jgi:hypothetical protein
MGGMRNAYKILVGRDHSEGLGLGGNVILEWILEKKCGKSWMHLAQIGNSGVLL